VQLAPALAIGAGAVHQARMYAAIDNTVTLPAFTRLDGALFLAMPYRTHAQLNVENVLDTRYYATSQGNNNIMPGASRTVRLSVSADF
jgi:catecholate siderophore receptor